MERAAIIGRLRAAGCVWAEDEADLLLAGAPAAAVPGLVERRAAGEPLEQVLGWASFCGLRIHVAPGVFVPRRRTEFLVHEAVRRSPPGPVVLDLCAGTGALGAAFSTLVDAAELHVAELDAVALGCAQRNVAAGTLLHQGDLFDALPTTLRARVDVLLANAPYVPSSQIPLLPAEARDYEPAHALDGGPDGLDLHRRIIAGAPRWLAPGGTLFIEVGTAQRDTACALMISAGLRCAVRTDDELGAVVVSGMRQSDPLTS